MPRSEAQKSDHAHYHGDDHLFGGALATQKKTPSPMGGPRKHQFVSLGSMDVINHEKAILVCLNKHEKPKMWGVFAE